MRISPIETTVIALSLTFVASGVLAQQYAKPVPR
jgi:flagellin-like protein